jgi:hypothetical protein
MSIYSLLPVLYLFASMAGGPPMVRASLEGNRIYTCGTEWSDREARVSGGGLLVVLRQDLRGENRLWARQGEMRVGGDATALFRWQLIDKNCYFVTYGDNGGGLDPGPGFRDRARLRSFSVPMLEAIYAHGLAPADRERRYREFRWSGDPYWRSFGTVLWANRAESHEVRRQMYYDIWARGNKFWEVYVTEPHRNNRLTREDFRPEKVKRDGTSGADAWETIGVWTFDWTGPFHVAVNVEDRYFVADIRTPPKWPELGGGGLPPKGDDPALVFGSRIFVAPRGAKPGTPLKEVWKGRRIEALIHDNESKTFFAFTRDEYLEIANPINPKRHNIVVHRSNTANEALEVAARCGRVIRGIPEPKKKP